MRGRPTLAEVTRILKGREKELKKRYGVKRLGVFGSYTRGEAKAGSDLDILIEFERDAKTGLLKFVEIENYLSDLIGVKVDLVEKSSLKPRIGRQILSEVVYT